MGRGVLSAKNSEEITFLVRSERGEGSVVLFVGDLFIRYTNNPRHYLLHGRKQFVSCTLCVNSSVDMKLFEELHVSKFWAGVWPDENTNPSSAGKTLKNLTAELLTQTVL